MQVKYPPLIFNLWSCIIPRKEPSHMKFRTIAMIGAVVAAAHVWAGEFRYIDMNKVFGEYYQTLQKEEGVKVRQTAVQAEIQRRVNEINRISRDIESSKILLNNTTDSNQRTQCKEIVRDLQLDEAKKKAEFEDYVNIEKDKLQKESSDLRNELVKKITAELETFAKTQQNVEAIVDVSGLTANLIPVVPYYDKNKDVTGDFLKVLNKDHQAEVDAALAKRKADADAAAKANDPAERLKKLKESMDASKAPAKDAGAAKDPAPAK